MENTVHRVRLNSLRRVLHLIMFTYLVQGTDAVVWVF
jgi:hypothetical protein